tara:strand:- start:168 stop:449 length:282 start_codon:yes stop_codon:yes gene_type:complete
MRFPRQALNNHELLLKIYSCLDHICAAEIEDIDPTTMTHYKVGDAFYVAYIPMDLVAEIEEIVIRMEESDAKLRARNPNLPRHPLLPKRGDEQ